MKLRCGAPAFHDETVLFYPRHSSSETYICIFDITIFSKFENQNKLKERMRKNRVAFLMTLAFAIDIKAMLYLRKYF